MPATLEGTRFEASLTFADLAGPAVCSTASLAAINSGASRTTKLPERTSRLRLPWDGAGNLWNQFFNMLPEN
jgi:hypothetical protein